MVSAIVDSMILMHYDNGHDQAIDWWERSVEDGWRFYVSIISLMERFKGIAGMYGSRDEVLQGFRERLYTMKREKKIIRVLPITRRISDHARKLMVEYCRRKTPSSNRGRMEALICDMLIAATALEQDLPLFTFNSGDFDWISELALKRPDYEIVWGGDV